MIHRLIVKSFVFFLFIIITDITLHAQDIPQKKHSFSWNLFLDTYYSYDFGQPANHRKPSFLYNHNRHNEVNINLALAGVSYNDSTMRANLGLMAGTYPLYNLSSEPEIIRHIYEAYIGIKIFKAKELWLDVGILPSHIGFETAISKDCWTLTRSILAENSPYYEAGLRASYKSPNAKWYIAALLLNGWQRITRINGNNTASFGSQVTFNPTSKISLNSSTFIGNDKPDSLKQMRYFHNFYAIIQLNKNLSLTTGFDIGAEQKSKGSSAMNTWYSPVLMARYIAAKKITFAARVEYYRDRKGVIILASAPNGFQTFGFSANIDYAVQKNVLWRIEGRILKSKDQIFDYFNTSRSSSSWLTTSLSVAIN